MKHNGRALLLIGAFLLGGSSPANPPDQAEIREAIERGATNLKGIQLSDGSWRHNTPEGATALAALTLLECATPADDPVIQKAASYLREKSIPLRHTYSIALGLMFFDRLGDPADEPLIQSLAIRLLEGQGQGGGWGYTCPGPDASESERLLQAVMRRAPSNAKPPPSTSNRPNREQAVSQSVRRQIPVEVLATNFLGDNSNTQFATLGVWVARRHGVSADNALARVKARFHNSQQLDGGWPYMWSGPVATQGNSTATMTCAGLLGLGAAHAAASQAIMRTQREKRKGEAPSAEPQPQDPKPLRDPAIHGGFAFLGEWVDSPIGGRGLKTAVTQAWRLQPSLEPTNALIDFYLLWSIERVSMAYGRRTIGHREWFPWGANIILTAQKVDGSWAGSNATGGVDTCFALLFLTRSNLAPDLTASLKGRVREGEVKLRAGGVASEHFNSPSPKEATALKKPRTGPELVMPEKLPGDHAVPAEDAAPPAPSAEAVHLSNRLATALPEERTDLIDKLRDGKGAVNTEALALSIAALSGAARAEARAALADRLTRMSEATLAEKLHDASAEVRRGACLACAMRESKRFIPELVRLLEDREALVGRAAHAALMSLTGEDLGPGASDDAAERKRAIERWKDKWIPPNK